MYYSLLMLDRQVEITTETAAIYKENVRVMEAMKIAGMTTEAAVAQMRAASHQVEASLMELKRQVRETENSLSVLLAKAPQTIDRNTLDEQVMPEELAAGVPMQLLENRPDVKIAEMTLASAYYTTNSARAAFYPGLNIRYCRLDKRFWYFCGKSRTVHAAGTGFSGSADFQSRQADC